ncbi:MAG: hypothetical protein U5L72_10495 [Bacteroidales bacterium]|nr:hypothetical protein [Bacteroidales bacterium]
MKTRKFILRTDPLVAAYSGGLFSMIGKINKKHGVSRRRGRPSSHIISWSTGSLTVTGMR